MIISLLKMERGERGKIVRLEGGKGFQGNMRARGIREGKMLVVKQIQPWGGPVLINVEGEEVALGRGMAEKIFIDIPERKVKKRSRSGGKWRRRERERTRFRKKLRRRHRGRGP